MSPSDLTPALEKSGFTERLVRENRLDHSGFKAWFFQPGMAFRSMEKWWGSGGFRRSPHEGIDLCLFKDNRNQMHHLNAATKIPAMYDGVVVRIITDFLGLSIFMEHRLSAAPDGRLFTLFGHTLPAAGIGVGKIVAAGDFIATLAAPWRSGKNIPPHLHISLGWASQPVSHKRMDWHTINDPSLLTLINPWPVMD
jgi:murein DD-endopeptidase MepM/ murein hydrolase activator NlpD